MILQDNYKTGTVLTFLACLSIKDCLYSGLIDIRALYIRFRCHRAMGESTDRTEPLRLVPKGWCANVITYIMPWSPEVYYK